MKVLIVDDSVVFRTAIKTALSDTQDIEKIDVASNGKIALEKLQQGEYDAITLDLEMPVMDGIETIQKIREFNKKIAIIIFSAQNLNAANKTLKALELGADDFVQKLQNSDNLAQNLQNIQNELVPRFNALVKRRGLKEATKTPISSQPQTREEIQTNEFQPVDLNGFKANLIVIGSSTGGPDLLMKLFKEIPKLDVPILLVQHMPPVFTTQLAKALNGVSGMEVSEAQHGDILKPGHCYIAPGDYHMRLNEENGNYSLTLDQEAKVCYVRPAVDCLFESVANKYRGKVAAFILTGMGSDGANGCVELKKNKAAVVIQDQASAVVWGMPGAVHAKKCYDSITSPNEIIKLMNQMGKL